MSCVICNNPFVEGDKKTESPCGCIAHTVCGFKMLADYIDFWSRQPLSCPSCNNIVYKSRYIIDAEDEKKQVSSEIDRLNKNALFMNDLKIIKIKKSKLVKACNVFKQYLKPKKVLFKNAITPHIDVIKGIHSQIKKEVKLEPSYKAHTKAYSSFILSRERFCKKYDISPSCLRKLNLATKYRYRFHSNSPFNLIKKSFRIYMSLW